MPDLKTINSALANTSWLVEPAEFRRLVARIASIPTCPTSRELATCRADRLAAARRLPTLAITGQGIDAPEEAKLANGGTKAVRGAKKVGLIPIHGPIEQRMSAELEKLGGTSTEEVGVGLDALLADKTVDAIVLHIDSPGGSSYGTEELADKIFNARGTKKIYAIADAMAASAAYWIGSAADMLMVTPSGMVGSIGVYTWHVDESKALEAEGMNVTMVAAGKYKVELASVHPLTDTAKAHMQEIVDTIYTKFVKAVGRNRNTPIGKVRKDYGEGRVLMADDALEAGMVDRIIPFDELLRKLTGAASANGQTKASMEILRLRQERRKAVTT